MVSDADNVPCIKVIGLWACQGNAAHWAPDEKELVTEFGKELERMST